MAAIEAIMALNVVLKFSLISKSSSDFCLMPTPALFTSAVIYN
jgi:hypothetical protein